MLSMHNACPLKVFPNTRPLLQIKAQASLFQDMELMNRVSIIHSHSKMYSWLSSTLVITVINKWGIKSKLNFMTILLVRLCILQRHVLESFELAKILKNSLVT